MTDYQNELRHVRRLGRLLLVLTTALIVVIGVYAWPLVRGWFSHGGSGSGSREITPRGKLADIELSTIQLFKDASPSVAFITTETRRNINRRAQNVPNGAGSGFVWDEATGGGYYIVTNFHVIKDASVAHVILSDQTSYDADIIGGDADHDMAVLRINTPAGVQLVKIPIGESKDLQVGQYVLAIGNPFGLDQSLSTGVISALNRTINSVADTPIDGVIQTDAAINPGNSGGPLLDSAGRLIGMNTAILSPSGAWNGIGFAIPVDTINRIVPQIVATGHVTRAKLGIQFDDDLSRALLARAGLKGLAISDVEPGSPAAKAGLLGITQNFGRGGRGGGAGGGAAGAGGGGGYLPYALGDVLTGINDHAIKSGSDLFTAMDRIKPGEIVDVVILRTRADGTFQDGSAVEFFGEDMAAEVGRSGVGEDAQRCGTGFFGHAGRRGRGGLAGGDVEHALQAHASPVFGPAIDGDLVDDVSFGQLIEHK